MKIFSKTLNICKYLVANAHRRLLHAEGKICDVDCPIVWRPLRP